MFQVVNIFNLKPNDTKNQRTSENLREKTCSLRNQRISEKRRVH
ncbi:hypothetical protein M153_8800012310 [Pseudoloma neurophilia]|uniref:Uncharacterized protein n=1 Tax=Pseudoloma neurophilia TaxID=146866 RepID=A0A0R0M0A3_9MICR|nr:hypothetical protein M153_8800012310 [Pseudoloma neurophilia]